MRPKWPKLATWPRKFAHSSFTSSVHSLLPKDNLFKNILDIKYKTMRGHMSRQKKRYPVGILQ